MTYNFGAGFDHFAGPFEPYRRADPAMAAMRDAACGGKVGAIEGGGAHPHQHFVRLRFRLHNVAQRESLVGRNARFHVVLPDCRCRLALDLVANGCEQDASASGEALIK
jgi:hypothetical protein